VPFFGVVGKILMSTNDFHGIYLVRFGFRRWEILIDFFKDDFFPLKIQINSNKAQLLKGKNHLLCYLSCIVCLLSYSLFCFLYIIFFLSLHDRILN
jgi:hypothetical protein